MSTVNKAASALYGAIRLARLDTGGMKYFDVSPAGFWHSFTAAIIVLPLYIGTVVARWGNLSDDVNGFRYFCIEAIAYVIAWTVFPVLMSVVVRAIDRDHYYIRSIVAYNWASVLQNLLYMPVAILSLSGVGGTEPLTMMILFLVMFYTWFVLKTALDVSPFTAWMLVAMDLVVSMVLSFWSDTLIWAS